VFVHNNLRLLSRCSDEYLTGPTQMWNVGGDGFETFDGVGFKLLISLWMSRSLRL